VERKIILIVQVPLDQTCLEEDFQDLEDLEILEASAKKVPALIFLDISSIFSLLLLACTL